MNTAIAIPQGQTPEQVRSTYLKSERAAREGGVVCYVASALFSLGAVGAGVAMSSRYEMPGIVVVTCLLSAIATGYFLLGRALRKLAGWSPTVGVIASILLLPAVPLGTAMGGLLLLSLSRADRFVFSRTYKEVIEATGGKLGELKTAPNA
jgi:hypothetical protein